MFITDSDGNKGIIMRYTWSMSLINYLAVLRKFTQIIGSKIAKY